MPRPVNHEVLFGAAFVVAGLILAATAISLSLRAPTVTLSQAAAIYGAQDWHLHLYRGVVIPSK